MMPIDEQKSLPGLLKVISHGQACLTGPDHQHI